MTTTDELAADNAIGRVAVTLPATTSNAKAAYSIVGFQTTDAKVYQ